MSPESVTLVGLRCSGKSTVGRELARLLGLGFVDLDEMIAGKFSEEAGEDPCTVGEVLERIGVPAFRELESRCLREVLGDGPVVVATGGGAVEAPGNRSLLSASRCLWLDAPVEVLAARLRADPTLRPALLGGGDPAAELAELHEKRAPLYREVASVRLQAAPATALEVARTAENWLREAKNT